jgi:hypothetical protein
MEEWTERLVYHLEAGLASTERGRCRYHMRHALQYAEALRTPDAGAGSTAT